MKRLREEEEEEVNMWEECLVEDMRHVIEHKLNTLSLLLLSLTSKMNYDRYHDTVVDKRADVITTHLLLQYGTQDLFQTVYPQCVLNNRDAFLDAASYGNLDALKWLDDNQTKRCFTDYILNCAIESGNIDCVKWLMERGCEFNNKTFPTAARVGSLEIMQLLKERNCPWFTDTFDSAVQHGKLSNMIWLRENGCPFDSLSYARAAEHGNLTNLKWLKDQFSCPLYNPHIVIVAIASGSIETVKWLVGEGFFVHRSEALWEAVKERNLEMMEWLKTEIQCPLYANLWSAVLCHTYWNDEFSSDDIPVLEWLHLNKCPWTSYMSCLWGRKKHVNWFKEHGYS